MNITLNPKEIFKKKLYLILFLLLANTLGVISTHYFNHPSVYGLVPLFDFNNEANIPTLYSSMALVVASLLLFTIAFSYKKRKLSYLSWFGLAIIFLFLSIDEISSIHERFALPTKEALGTSGYYAWVIPYGAALVAFVLVYIKFLMALPRKIMILFLISGSIYVSAVIGFEVLGSMHNEAYGTNNITYALLTTCEEFLEMFGIALFVYTLLTYMVEQFESTSIVVVKQNL